MFKSKKVIELSDWKYFEAALITYSMEPFQSHELKSKVVELLRKYQRD